MKDTLIPFSFLFLLSPTFSQVYPSIHSEGELVVGENIGDLSGTRITVGDPSNFSGINIGQQMTDRAFLLWAPDQNFFKIGTVEDNIAFDNTAVFRSGNLGLGTNNPGSKLTIFQPSGDVRLSLKTNASWSTHFEQTESSVFSIYNGGQPRMTILAGGQIGLGTETPQERLDVNGKTRLRSTLTTEGISNLEGRLNLGKGAGTNELNIFDIGDDGDAIIRAQTTGGANEMVLGVSPSGGLFGTVSNDILNLRTNNTTRMSITSSGNVGIGTTSPGEKLEVSGNLQLDRGSTTSGLTRSLKIQGARNASGNSFARIDFRNIDNDGSNTEYTGATISSQNFDGDNSGNLVLAVDGILAMTINPLALEVQGDLFPTLANSWDLGTSTNKWNDVWADNPFIQTSDFREKTEIENINYGLEDILNLRPVSYKWKDKTYEDPHLGLIAQEVQQTIPEVVVDKDFRKDPNSGEVNVEVLDRLGMRSTELIPVLIKAIQEQHEIIDQQSKDIADLKKIVDALMAENSSDL